MGDRQVTDIYTVLSILLGDLAKRKLSACLVPRLLGAQWLSGRVLDSKPRGIGFESHRRHCVVSLSKNINPSLVLVQPRKTRPFITERLLMGCKESNQTKQNKTKTSNRGSEAHWVDELDHLINLPHSEFHDVCTGCLTPLDIFPAFLSSADFFSNSFFFEKILSGI